MKFILFPTTLFIIAVAVLNIIDLPIELRFENTKYNYLFVMTLCFLLPLTIFLTSLTFKKRANTYLAMVISIVIALPSALLYFYVSSEYKTICEKGIDYSFEKIQEVKVRKSIYRLYRTNGGATTSFGLVLRKETPFFSGINAVKVVFSKYKASEGTLSITDKNLIKIQIQPYSKEEKLEIVTLDI